MENFYYEKYGFSRDPFVKGKFFTPNRDIILEQLYYYSSYDQSVMLCLGIEGSGKTSLGKCFVKNLSEHNPDSSILNLSGENLKNGGFLESLGIYFSVEPYQVSISSKLEQLSQNKQRFYLLIDDAHLMNLDSWIEFIEFVQMNQVGDIQVILFAQPDVTELISNISEKMSLEKNFFKIIHLEPYTFNQMCQYLSFRMEAAGRKLNQVLGNEQLEFIYDKSFGQPGLINKITRDLLMNQDEFYEDSFLDRIHTFINTLKDLILSLPRINLIIISIIFLFLVILLLFMDKGGKRTSAEQKKKEVVFEKEINSFENNNIDNNTEDVKDHNNTEDDAFIFSKENDGKYSLDKDDTYNNLTSKEPLLLPKDTNENKEISSKNKIKEVVISEKNKSETSNKVRDEVKLVKKDDSLKKKNINKENHNIDLKKMDISKESKWYQKQNSSGYVYQILSTNNEDKARSYLLRGGTYHYYRKMLKGKIFYVLTWGHFPTKQSAENNLELMPEEFKNTKYLIKSINSIKQEIK